MYSNATGYPTRTFSELSRYINQINNQILRDEAKKSLEDLRNILMKEELMRDEYKFEE